MKSTLKCKPSYIVKAMWSYKHTSSHCTDLFMCCAGVNIRMKAVFLTRKRRFLLEE